MTTQPPCLPPGFRFHPTDEELILYYLKNRAGSTPCPVPIIAEVDIYKFDPWELPEKAMFGDKEWYFFTPRDRKYPNGVRPNRAAATGYWKATGTDKPIVSSKGNENIGVKKALVFYRGKPPKGIKTNWIMHEYRLTESKNKNAIRPLKLRDCSMRLDDWVLCRIYQKSSHQAEDSSAATSESPIANLQSYEQQYENVDVKLHKSLSLSELLNEADFSLLSRLLEAPAEPEMISSLNYQPFINMHQFSETGSSVSIAESSLKRQRMAEDQGMNLLQSSKKQNNNSLVYTSFANQFDPSNFYNPQLLLNSQLGMQ